MTEDWRAPNEWESALMERLLHVADFGGREALLDQWSGALVQRITDDGTFLIRPRPDTPDAATPFRIPTQGELGEGDALTHVLLHVVDGRMVEVEIYGDGFWPSAGFSLDGMEVWQPQNWPREIGWA